jgi:hypothetical protein
VIFSIGLLLACLPALPLRADYLVTFLDGKTVRTPSYWIQGKKLHLAGVRETVNVYDVKSVESENLTPDEIKAHDTSLDGFRSQVLKLLETETDLAVAQADALQKISQFPVGRKNAIPGGEKKALRAALTDQEGKVAALLNDWRNLKLPDFSLVKMRDIKELMLLSLDASLEQAIRFVDKDDPTHFAYARANLGQYASFEDTFRDALPWE